MWLSARTDRSSLREVGGEAVLDLYCSVAGAEDALLFAPIGEGGREVPEEIANLADNFVIGGNEAQTVVAVLQFRSEVEQGSQFFKIRAAQPSFFHLQSIEDTARNRLGRNSGEDSAPVVERKLRQCHESDRE